MKSVPVVAAIALMLAGTTSAEARQSHHSRHHRAHIRHSHFVGKANLRPTPHIHAVPVYVAVVSAASPRAITVLPLPPSDAPEFGSVAEVKARTSAVTAAASRTDSPASIAAQRSKLPEVAMLVPPAPKPGPAVRVAPTVAPAVAPPAAPTVVAAPVPTPAPAAVAVAVSTPAAVPPAPAPAPAPQPAPEAPAPPRKTIVPEHEDDDLPATGLSGGYVALPRVTNPRTFPELVPLRGYDISISATTVFNRAVSNPVAATNNPAIGFLASFHRHTDIRWLDIEAHYGLTQATTVYAPVGNQPSVTSSRMSQEATGDLLLRRHLNHAHPYRLLPYLGVGGGMLYFHQWSNGASNLSPTGLIDAGFDIPTNSQHLSLRLGSHVLVYPTPNFGSTAISGWSVSTQPAAGVLFHF